MLFSPDQTWGVARPDQVAGLTGIEMLQAMLAGRLPAPPISRTMGFTLVSVAPGEAVFEGEPSEALLNPLGTVHGGWALTLVDSATGCAAHTVLPAGVGYTSVETKMNFSRPILPGMGRVRCEGRVVNAGRQIISAEARLLAPDGKLLGHGTSTVMVLTQR
jgi:uncharacterized protein (TIGR00369 family)